MWPFRRSEKRPWPAPYCAGGMCYRTKTGEEIAEAAKALRASRALVGDALDGWTDEQIQGMLLDVSTIRPIFWSS